MAARFVRNIQALAATTAERVLGAVLGVLLATLRQLTGLPALTMP
jgi:urea transporter